MRNLLGAFILIILGACSGGSGSSDMGSGCLTYAAAGGNNFSNPSFAWDQLNCACPQEQVDGSAPGGSCTSPQACTAYCCSCPSGSPKSFNARACMNNACLDKSACQAVLASDTEPCR